MGAVLSVVRRPLNHFTPLMIPLVWSAILRSECPLSYQKREIDFTMYLFVRIALYTFCVIPRLNSVQYLHGLQQVLGLRVCVYTIIKI